MTKVVFVFFLLPIFCFSQFDKKIKLNHIRIIASHNSYKGFPNPKVLRFLDRIKDKYANKISSEDQVNFKENLKIINNQIKQIENLVNEFSDFARMPKPIFKKNDLCWLLSI